MPLFTGEVNANQVTTDLIVVNKKNNTLAYFQDGKKVKEFAVATGKSPSLTPEGKFKIANKIKNRPYYKEKIEGGAPNNPLGDRWIGLDVNGTQGTTYAIHGNSNKNSIGKYVSAGCIRMYNDEVTWLFNQVAKGSYVIITTSKLSFEEIAKKNGYPIGVKVFSGRVFINAEERTLKDPLELVNSRLYIPLRECMELLGASVQWDNEAKLATISIGGRTLIHKPLTSIATVNGNEVTIIPSRYQGSTVMLPLRNTLELIGIQVTWQSENNTLYLSNK
ncbi:L,D-transpeptidase family protein [Paenibacillus sp. CMAA1364]